MHTDALVAELESGRISAALDVVDPEPLPADHPLWRAPHLLLSPHVGGNSTRWTRAATGSSASSCGATPRGEPLANVVTGDY